MKIFVTYSNETYKKTRDFCAMMAKKRGGFDKVIVYDNNDIDEDFKKKNEKILNQKRGAGLWLWKPYIIYKAIMEVASEGDYVFYADAGSFFIRDASMIINTIDDSDIWVSDIPLVEKQFTKPSAFKSMGCDNEKIKNSRQIQGNFFCIKKSSKSIKFAKEWLDFCSDYSIISSDCHEDNLEPLFVDHRFDQSILSLLSKKHGIKPHLDPSQYGRFPKKYKQRKNWLFYDIKRDWEYPTCIILHRTRDVNKWICFKQILSILLPYKLVTILSKNYYE